MRLTLLIIFTVLFFSEFGNAQQLTKNKGDNSGNEKTPRTLIFSGITWQVRNGTGNPGGNNWSDSPESVWVDEMGILHLNIRKINGSWYCSEIYSDQTVGYGRYKIYIASNVEDLNENVVLGFFTYLDDSNEIDIEFSKWGKGGEKNAGNYVVQPSVIKGNSENFNLRLARNISTHQFVWDPNRINFKSWQGNDTTATDTTFIHKWDYVGKNIPSPGNEKLIINLWLYRGVAPSDGKEVEVLIKAVEMTKCPSEKD